MKTKKRHPLARGRTAHPTPDRAEIIANAAALAAAGKFPEALRLILPLAVQYPRDVAALTTAAEIYARQGDPWRQLDYMRRAAAYDLTVLPALDEIFLVLDLRMLRVLNLRRIIKQTRDPQDLVAAKLKAEIAEASLRTMTGFLGKNQLYIEDGLRLMEEAQVALHTRDFPRSIQLNLQSAKILPDFPPPLNNLSLAYFYSGQWKHAIQIARNVIQIDPDNIQARANLVQYLFWTGSESEAASLWEALKQVHPLPPGAAPKVVETAALMEDDQVVYKLLHPQQSQGSAASFLDIRNRFCLAVAEANLGKPGARNKFTLLAKEGYPPAAEILTALKKGQTGCGLSSRFSYTHVSELLPAELIAQIENLGQDEEHIQRWDKTVKQLTERHPQIVLAAKKMIYEEDMAEAGCELLAQIGSQRSFAVLREFGLGQVGAEQNRTKALMKLLEAGEIKNGTRVDFWRAGAWTEIELRHILVTDEDDRPYSRQVLKTLDQGLEFYRRDQLDRSEKAYLRALELEPRAKEAYNNLGTIYANRGEHDQAMVMLRKALEIDPLYIMPRCNLAIFLIEDKRLDEAVETLKPLDAIERATPQAMAQLSYVRARIALLQDHIDLAQQMAKTALQFNPQFEAAGDLLDRIETISRFQSTFSGWGERDRARREQARKKLQQKITHPTPTLAETLSLYSKEILVAVAREWDLPSGWTALKKAPLFDLLSQTMLVPEYVSGVLARLDEEDRAALTLVRDRGGVIAWDEFSTAFDHDLDASPYWQYHQPETVMGRLRARCLLVEITVDGNLCLAVPVELRPLLANKN